MKKVAKQTAWRNRDLVWWWNNRHARKLWNKHKHRLNIDEFRNNGIAVTNTEELMIDFKELIDFKDGVKETFTNRLKPFLVEYWNPQDYTVDFSNPFAKAALNPLVLATIANYLGCAPRLYDIRLWETKVMEEGQDKKWSQMWHRDPEDKQLANFFIYLNDVDAGTGPFTYIPETNRFGRYWKRFPQVLPPYGSYPPEDQVDAFFAGKIKEYTAPAGTVIFADTAGLHKGGYSKEKPRFLFKCLFITDGNFKNVGRRYKVNIDPKELNELQRYALWLD